MKESDKEVIVQCSVKIASWSRYQSICKKVHLNAVPYFCEILTNELKLIERTIKPNELRDKKKHSLEYFGTQERKVAKISMKKPLSDNLNRISKNINISRDAIIEEVLSLILDCSSYNFQPDIVIFPDSIMAEDFNFFGESSSDSSMFSPLRLIQAGLQSPRYHSMLFSNHEETREGEMMQSTSKWYDGLGYLGLPLSPKVEAKRRELEEELKKELNKEINKLKCSPSSF